MVSRTHYCCPTCRVAVKTEWGGRDLIHSCGKRMVPMGRNFRAPRKDNKSQWLKISLAIETAFQHHPNCFYAGKRNEPAPHMWCNCPYLKDYKTPSDVKSGMGLRRSRKKNWA